ncbi:hypothetical protein BDK51DRAFT_28348 [Blyttiomyces helicus]|uniref:PDEase domain-containing protein n=1 Tax=Blyttiomyces helicus TaxID=388810 RepID=A0A4P9WK83_9FUNG|nr:hypothetical protein BDK51DRAFT_28348 [Blyttiomyces helicus]|eukprot:RKO92515.1 hypothetical protein BDK51DRAFT_28348 [Blyttiomyces helicus]
MYLSDAYAHLAPLERLVVLVSCIGHDLDHPGLNNSFQINANTELALIYNDLSPLESHHAAVLFTILKNPVANILGTLTDADYKEARRKIILCILATDMGRHGEILAKFKTFADAFKYDDKAHRDMIIQIIIKCADISNEVRPPNVSEPWVDNLLEEFFAQSDKEKAMGLPFAPFMDRDKVTKSGAQVGFIKFVMLPLFELASKALPNLETPILGPIREALVFYQEMDALPKK